MFRTYAHFEYYYYTIFAGKSRGSRDRKIFWPPCRFAFIFVRSFCLLVFCPSHFAIRPGMPHADSPDLDAAFDAEWRIAALCGLSDPEWTRLGARAEEMGAHPLDLAIGEGAISEARFLAALASLLGVSVTEDPPPPREGTVAAEAWALRIYRAEGMHRALLRIAAPAGAQAAYLVAQKRQGRLPPMVLTRRQAMLDRLVAASGAAIARDAAETLPAALSARRIADGNRGTVALAAALVLAFLLGSAIFPFAAATAVSVFLSPIFVVAGLAVFTASLESRREDTPPPELPAARLPRYTLLVPLFREANVVDALIARLTAIRYPRDRIEVFFLVEPDDPETLAALNTAPRHDWMHILTAPPGAPRTKPRALNIALPFASGDMLVVFDAEDAPDTDQLLRAAELFAVAGPETACAQARLAISNPRDNPLTRRFALDYAALFDCVKAGSARIGWAVPLGGSSNHFRVPALRQVGGWDAWNVTEDADLGIRLARFGWLVEDLPSTTWEEAPNTLAAWMNQRTRWMKGWMQTLLVHARDPRQLIEQLGPFRTLLIAATGLSVVLGALLYPVFALAVALRFLDPTPLGAGSPLLAFADSMLLMALAIAVLVEIIPATIALWRRRALFLMPWITAAPIWYCLMSIAAWRALLEFARKPFHWHKTAHGTARRAGGLSGVERDGGRCQKQ
jgi:cellulose synthase/poly-beta-1,6-N-acetylglucosamine synthase-like glycosyltransferase